MGAIKHHRNSNTSTSWNLANIKKKGKVQIKKRDGSSFVLSPLPLVESPLNVRGINIDLSSQEIIDVLKETRAR